MGCCVMSFHVLFMFTLVGTHVWNGTIIVINRSGMGGNQPSYVSGMVRALNVDS
jgi:hypothetical protein